jgi:hypothetical protein
MVVSTAVVHGRVIDLVNEFTGLYVWVIPGISGYRLY